MPNFLINSNKKLNFFFPSSPFQHAFIRITDDAPFLSSTPECSRRGFTHSLPSQAEPSCGYSTPQVPRRRGLGRDQSSPAIGSSRGGERGSRILSLTLEGELSQEGQEGMFSLDGNFDDGTSPTEPSSEDDEERHIDDSGLHFTASNSVPDPNSSQSSFGSEGYSSPGPVPTGNHTPSSSSSQQQQPQTHSRPQSSITLRTREGEGFDRNRSMSYPSRRRPNSASTTSQRRVILEDNKELLGESLDSGLEASSETSIASTDSTLQYSTLGVSAFCIYQAVKSMLDHK